MSIKRNLACLALAFAGAAMLPGPSAPAADAQNVARMPTKKVMAPPTYRTCSATQVRPGQFPQVEFIPVKCRIETTKGIGETCTCSVQGGGTAVGKITS